MASQSRGETPMIGAMMTCPPRVSPWFPSWPRVVDDGCGMAENFCRTIERAAEVGSHGWAVMVQDDMEPLEGLEDELPRLLASAPCSLVSGFSLRYARDPKELAAGVRWRIRRKRELLLVAFLAVRQELAPALVAGVRAGVGPHDDERMTNWLDSEGIQSATHLPSIVQHRGVKSITKKGWAIGGHPRIGVTFPEGLHARDLPSPPAPFVWRDR